MQIVILWLIYAAIAFGLRTLVQLRTTGRSGWVQPSRIRAPVERIAAALVAVSLTAAFVGTVLAVIAPEGSAWHPAALPAGARAAGLLLYIAGTVGTFLAQLAMGKSWRIGVDSTERTELVADGMFRFVRNPIYTAMLVSVGGLTLLCFTGVTLAGLAGLLVALELQVRAVEEPYLARTHGAAYLRYAATVGRFVPLLGRARMR